MQIKSVSTLKPQATAVLIPRRGAITSLRPNTPQHGVDLVALSNIK